MMGVTVSTPKYAALAIEAVRRWKAFTGLPCEVIHCCDSKAYQVKMELDQRMPAEPCIFFDADWWLLRPLSITWPREAWVAVHDAGVFHPGAFCQGDCERFGLDAALYFNSGFFAWDNALKTHRRVFEQARNFEHEQWSGKAADAMHDWGDQTPLNVGVQRAGVPLSLLPSAYNFCLHFVRGGCVPFIPRVVHAVHAAGFPLRHKMRHLKAAAELLSYEPEPMRPEAMAFHHALTFECR